MDAFVDLDHISAFSRTLELVAADTKVGVGEKSLRPFLSLSSARFLIILTCFSDNKEIILGSVFEMGSNKTR